MIALWLAIAEVGYLLLLGWRRRISDSLITLEISPPLYESGPPMQQLFIQLYELLRPRGWRLKRIMSLVILSDYSGGVRYLIGVDRSLEKMLKKQLYAFWPGIKIRNVSPVAMTGNVEVTYRWSFRHHYAFPLKISTQTGDPLHFLLRGMDGLDERQAVSWQLVIKPRYRSHRRMARRLANGQKFSLATSSLTARTGAAWVKTAKTLIRLAMDVAAEAIYGQESARYRRMNRAVVQKTANVRQRLEPISKLNGPLFATGLYMSISAGSRQQVKALSRILNAALSSFGQHQKLVKSRSFTTIRLPDRHTLLSVDELAGLYHFPLSRSRFPENLAVSGHVQLETPLEQKSGPKPDVVIGENEFRGRITPLGLSQVQRQKHMLIVGGTGMGKSSMMGYMFVQDMLAKKGVALIDPHGDLAEAMYANIPKYRIKDTVYLNPADLNNRVGLNLLELPSGLEPDLLDIYKDFVCESIVSIFRKIFSADDSGGHRIEYILRNAVYTAFSVPDATLFTIHKLLTNDLYRSSVVAKLSDGSLRDFWYGEYNKAGSYQRVKMIAGVTAKLGRFQRSSVTRKILEQSKSTLDFNDLLNGGKILIGNFAQGVIGEDTSQLLSMVLIAKIQLAALARQKLKPVDRRPFYLYIDEFQSLATGSMIQFVGEARKFGVNLVMAEQTTAHQDERQADVLIGNIGNIVCFRMLAEVDNRRLSKLFQPSVQALDLANLPSYRFYARLADGSRPEPVSGRTVLRE